MEILNIATELVEMEKINDIMSILPGKRNWVIRIGVYDGEKTIDYSGTFGNAAKKGYMGAMVKTIIDYKIRWFEYTYKKDFLTALSLLKNLGYK